MGRPKKGSGCGKGGGPGPTSQKKITGVGSGDSPNEKQQATAVARVMWYKLLVDVQLLRCEDQYMHYSVAYSSGLGFLVMLFLNKSFAVYRLNFGHTNILYCASDSFGLIQATSGAVYDDMEIHFRQEHFLCEDKDCLSKKFVVFSTNSELKRHTAMEHGGRQSRSKRNATLQIPVSFQYRPRRGYDEQNHERGGHGSLLDSPSTLISSVTQTSLAMGHTERFAQYILQQVPK
ncbi:hypothetical protein SLA2020_084520 [Shorea laevis]